MPKYNFFSSPSHGYLEVPAAIVDASGAEVSGHSYRERGNVYLEEDCDVVAFLRAIGQLTVPEMRRWIGANTVAVHVDTRGLPWRTKR